MQGTLLLEVLSGQPLPLHVTLQQSVSICSYLSLPLLLLQGTLSWGLASGQQLLLHFWLHHFVSICSYSITVAFAAAGHAVAGGGIRAAATPPQQG
jgi:hypothetical protein